MRHFVMIMCFAIAGMAMMIHNASAQGTGAIPFDTTKTVSVGTAVGGTTFDGIKGGEALDWLVGVNVGITDRVDFRAIGMRQFNWRSVLNAPDVMDSNGNPIDGTNVGDIDVPGANAWKGWLGVAVHF